MTATGTNAGHCSALEARLGDEIAQVVWGMNRGQTNEFARQFVERNESELPKKPIGKPFEEVYDIGTFHPKPEWLGVYEEVKDALIRMGVPLK